MDVLALVQNEFSCAICTEIYIKPQQLFPCAHIFCQTCLSQCRSKHCPMCRTTIGYFTSARAIEHFITAFYDLIERQGGHEMCVQERKKLLEQHCLVKKPKKKRNPDDRPFINGRAGFYFGGYGYCYRCGARVSLPAQ